MSDKFLFPLMILLLLLIAEPACSQVLAQWRGENRDGIYKDIDKDIDLDGKLLWKVPKRKEFFGKDYSERFPGARSNPTVYGGWVYICSGNGRIACIDADSGTEKWAVDMVRDLGGAPNQFSYSESLVVDQKYVYCFPGRKGAIFFRKNGRALPTSRLYEICTA